MDTLELIIIVTGLAGQALVTRQNRWGFVFWIIGNIALSCVFYNSGKFALIALHAVYSALQLWGFLAWAGASQEFRRTAAHTHRLSDAANDAKPAHGAACSKCARHPATNRNPSCWSTLF